MKARTSALLLCCSLLLLAGCSSTATNESSPERMEIRNLQTSIDILREGLASAQLERDRLQGLYTSAETELENLEATLANVELRYRARLKADVDSDQNQEAVANELALKKLELARLEEMSRDFTKERDKIRTHATRLESELRDARKTSESRQKRIDELEKQMAAAHEKVLLLEKSGAEIPSVVTEQMAALRREGDELRSQVATLEGVVAEARKERDSALKRMKNVLGAAATTTTPTDGAASADGSATTTTTVEPENESAFAFLVGWCKRSWAELRAGELNLDNTLFALLAVTLIGLSLYSLVHHIAARRRARIRRAKKKKGKPENQLQTQVAAPAAPRPDAGVRAPGSSPYTSAQVGPRPGLTTPSPLTPDNQVASSTDQTIEMPVAAPVASNPAARETVVIRKNGQRSGGVSEEDGLIQDLHRMIEKNFTKED